LNEAYLGFTKAVQLYLWSREEIDAHHPTWPPPVKRTHGVGVHAQVFFDHLWLGDHVERALSIANNAFPPVYAVTTTTFLELPMQFRKDPLTRLVFVYLSSSERAILGTDPSRINKWWIELPVSAP
jgi:hypothetical protein